MHQPRRAHHFAAEGFGDGLMPEAHTEDGQAAGEGADHVHRDAGIARRAGARRNAQMACMSSCLAALRRRSRHCASRARRRPAP